MIAPPRVSAQKRIDALRTNYDSLGNTSGAFLFPKEKGANLRSEALGVALAAGYKPAWEIATVHENTAFRG